MKICDRCGEKEKDYASSVWTRYEYLGLDKEISVDLCRKCNYTILEQAKNPEKLYETAKGSVVQDLKAFRYYKENIGEQA